ncbi:MAG TPA: lipopolysaccharide kinase InaA family protein [Verrucomicrobiae bacterium]|nr:lipopolysaccharide kinase InaA family protein [Verrucomicrobiae bacterium]
MNWEAREDFVPLLSSVLESPGEAVKNSGITSVTRHHLGDRQFYVKTQSHGQRWWWPLKYFFKAPRGRDEWRLAGRLERFGIPVVPHLAYGERWGRSGLRETTLITEGLAGYLPLPKATDLNDSTFQNRLGQLVRQMHEAGVIHEDLNRANLLYAATVAHLRLVDLDKIRLRPALTVPQRLSNIALIGARLPLTDSFFDAYGTGFPFSREAIRQRARTEREALASQISRRWRAHTSEMDVRRVGELRWRVRRIYDDKALAKILEAPDRLSAANENGFVLQQFGCGRSRADRCYREAYRLELLGVGAPRPVAVGEKRLLGICQRSYFVAKL